MIVYSKAETLNSVQSLSRVGLFATPWIAARQGLPAHHQLPEFTQIHVHRVSDAVQPYHARSSPSPPAPNPSQHQSLPVSQLFISGGQSTGVSALASFLPNNTQDWSPLGWTVWISLQSKGLSRVVSNTTVQKHQFFGAQLSSQSIKLKWNKVFSSCTGGLPIKSISSLNFLELF